MNPNRPQKVFPKDLEIIKKFYLIDKMNMGSIAKIYNCDEETIRYFLLKNNIAIRSKSHSHQKYTLNENYFEQIDTFEKAYFLGWLFADGCNSIKNAVSIGLQEQDAYILEKLNKCLESNRPISLVKKRMDSHQNIKFLKFCNKKLSNDLIKLGIIRQKSLIAQFPSKQQISSDLIFHFIRGYFEGDGCICISTIKSPSLSICVSYDFGIKLQQIFKNFDINSQLRKSTKIYVLSIGGRKQVIKTLDLIYKDSEEMRLTRKYQKYILAKNYIVPNYGTSKYKGVTFDKKRNIYMTYIYNKEGKHIYLGKSKDELDAAKAYDKYILDNHLNKLLNFPI